MRSQTRNILLKRLQQAVVSEILVKQAKARIRDKGADVGGYADLWANRAKPIRVKMGKKKTKMVEHYRKGGTPLRDTGNLFNSLSSAQVAIADGLRLILRAPLYGIFQHHGFTTSGPNFIPFTRGAVRKDQRALARREFVIAKHGVTVPARPILAMPLTAKREIARTIARALGAR